LPVAAAVAPAAMERLFATPPRVDWEKAAAAFGVAYATARLAPELGAALAAALARPGCTLIRAVVPPSDAAPRARRVRAAFEAALAAAPELRPPGTPERDPAPDHRGEPS